MHIKRMLDKHLLDAGVQFLFGCYVTDVLVGADGAPAGIVMANRAGRQAVRAKVIIDATERATVARLAGAKAAAMRLSSETIISIPGIGHFVSPHSPCAQRVIVSFLADPAAPDASCVAGLTPQTFAAPESP